MRESYTGENWYSGKLLKTNLCAKSRLRTGFSVVDRTNKERAKFLGPYFLRGPAVLGHVVREKAWQQLGNG